VTLSEAVKLAQKRVENKTFDVTVPLAAVINADYAASPDDRDHGPEGLLVVRGQRLDRPDLCDDDFNAALRPSLSLGKTVNPATDLIPAQIARLEKESGPLMDKTYTGVGGGPWLVEDGKVNKNADECESGDTGKWLRTPEPVAGCTGGGKAKKEKAAPASKIEGYGASCYSTWHSAAGLSGDGRWLFLVMNDKQGTNPEQLAGFMLERLGVRNALKFDGGGSAHLWFQGKGQAIALDPKHEGTDGRALSSYLAVFASKGDGIHLPLQATPLERVYYKVLVAGESADMDLQVRNTGAFSWAPEDGVELRHNPFFTLSPVVQTLPLAGPVAPGQVAEWKWRLGTGSISYERFQMVQRGKPFGMDFAVIVITMPKGMDDKRVELETAIRKLIDDWKAKGEVELDRLVKELQKQAEIYFKTLIQRLIDELLQNTCGSLGLIVLPLGFVVIGRIRRPRP